MNDFFGWGFQVGQLAGIRIRLHWLLLLFWFYELNATMAGGVSGRGSRVGAWLLWVALSFASILLHELGHCFAARKVGGSADDILMWPLGGLAFCVCPDNWRAHLIVAACGPLVTLGIVAVSYPTFTLLTNYFAQNSPEVLYNPYFWYAREILVNWNAFILILNLIPLYPLDGGRIFHSLAWGWHTRTRGWGSYGFASRLTRNVSRVTGACGVIYGLYVQNTQLVVLFAWALLSAEQLRARDWD